MNLSEITKDETEIGTFYICNNCGSHAEDDPATIKHHSTCKAGESKYWEDHYSKDQ